MQRSDSSFQFQKFINNIFWLHFSESYRDRNGLPFDQFFTLATVIPTGHPCLDGPRHSLHSIKDWLLFYLFLRHHQSVRLPSKFDTKETLISTCIPQWKLKKTTKNANVWVLVLGDEKYETMLQSEKADEKQLNLFSCRAEPQPGQGFQQLLVFCQSQSLKTWYIICCNINICPLPTTNYIFDNILIPNTFVKQSKHCGGLTTRGKLYPRGNTFLGFK